MSWIVLIFFIVFVLAIGFLYKVGKKVKEGEAKFKEMFKEEQAKANLSKYKKKYSGTGYKKAPSIKKK